MLSDHSNCTLVGNVGGWPEESNIITRGIHVPGDPIQIKEESVNGPKGFNRKELSVSFP